MQRYRPFTVHFHPAAVHAIVVPEKWRFCRFASTLGTVDTAQAAPPPTTFELSNGQTVTVRLIRQGDASLLVDMFHHLSDLTRRLRFHAYTGSLPQERIWREAVALSDLDVARHMAWWPCSGMTLASTSWAQLALSGPHPTPLRQRQPS